MEASISQSPHITSNSWPARMRRKMASDYLREEYGITLSPATMAKQAVLGRGCPFWKDGAFPLYGREQLDIYAAARLGPLRRSTSDDGRIAA